MASRIQIAVDLMSGDLGLDAALPAALQSLAQFSDLDIILVGRQPDIDAAIQQSYKRFAHRVTIVHADTVVTMADRPSFALRNKIDSSMRIAVDLLHSGQVQAVVSAGNTGALMAICRHVLKLLDGIERPAICSLLPTTHNRRYFLDLGANVDSSAEHLHQFAIMGAALCSVVDGIDKPKIALLNIGKEKTKGNEQVKLAHQLLSEDQQLNYIGFVEGNDLLGAPVSAEVVVCDGFIGNIALKACEGTANYIRNMLVKELSGSIIGRFLAGLVKPALANIEQQLDPEHYNGASFLGLRGTVVKSHGHSSCKGFQRAIAQAYREARNDVVAAISDKLA